MRVEIPLERLAELYRLVTLGRLIHGLVHNLNGPLQNLGMDMEMLEHSIKTDDRMPRDLTDPMVQRLRRMEGEFDQINRLIRSVSNRASLEGDYLEYGNLRVFMEEELSLLNANLYFKHNVQKEVLLEEGLPPLTMLPEMVTLSLAWFIQSLAEELEKARGKHFSLTARFLLSTLEITFSTEAGSLSSSFMQGLTKGIPSTGVFKVEEADLGQMLSVAWLKLSGVSFECSSDESGSVITLRVPVSDRLSGG
ncbi:MAG: HAMP domain-containing histidine kinase [Deltaproteobacteria bacterium]|nr:HAMP domain-containing histidine kinase [Deltaproteobacteria bacterium]